ncbi:MAG: hypothetical protein HYS26_01125 [Candidatus Kaiserbacteria bacterium]|nr:MAG: hypothetical protein HYS26_01125 [Candidatus Kaiserbacteria bacterium]
MNRWSGQKILVIGVIAIVVFIFAYMQSPKMMTPEELARCFSENPAASHGYRADFSCVQETVNQLMQQFSTPKLMRYITNESSPPSVVSSCHVTAHAIGQLSIERGDGLEETLAACTGLCRNGCKHGAIAAAAVAELADAYDEDIAHADAATIGAIGAKYCTAKTQLCHGIGHLLYIATQDFDEALKSCESIADGDEAERCYLGVFMEAVGEENSLAFRSASATIATDDPAYPCDSVDAQYRHACFFELAGFQRDLLARTRRDTSERAALIVEACNAFTGGDQRDCYTGYGYSSVEQLNQSASSDPGQCGNFGNVSQRDACSVGVVLKYVDNRNYTEALEYCRAVGESEREQQCFNAAFQNMESETRVDSLSAECGRVSEPHVCIAALERYTEKSGSLPAND